MAFWKMLFLTTAIILLTSLFELSYHSLQNLIVCVHERIKLVFQLDDVTVRGNVRLDILLSQDILHSANILKINRVDKVT